MADENGNLPGDTPQESPLSQASRPEDGGTKATKRVTSARVRKCKAIKVNGGQCSSVAMGGSDYCFAHDPRPQFRERLKAAAKLGNAVAQRRMLPVSLPKVDLSNADGVRNLLQDTAEQVRAGTLSASQGNSVAALVAQSLRLAELSLDARLARLEALLKAQGGEVDHA